MIRGPDIDFELLRRVNPDVIGWIHLEGTPISYPVTKGCGDYYLHHNVSREESPHGCIYAEFDGEFPTERFQLHGHNMKDNSMFTNILFYYFEDGFYEKHPVIDLKTPEADYGIRVWGTIHYPPGYEFMQCPPKEENAFRKWKKAIKALCPFEPTFDLALDDDIAVLCTCRPFQDEPYGTLIVVGKVERTK